MSTDTAIVERNHHALVPSEMSVQQIATMHNAIVEVYRQLMQKDHDYGIIPGTKEPTLYKPGAIKLCQRFGIIMDEPEILEEVQDWTGEDHKGEPFFFYKIRQRLYRGESQWTCISSCNSWESKYRYRWVPEEVARQRPDFDKLPTRGGSRTLFEPDFALGKMETTGKYGKPAEYWQRFTEAIENGTAKRTRKALGQKEFDGYQITVDEKQYRIPNPDIADVVNTILRMAQKRALLGSVELATNCTSLFAHEEPEMIDAEYTVAAPAPLQNHPPKKAPEPEEPEASEDYTMLHAVLLDCWVQNDLDKMLQEIDRRKAKISDGEMKLLRIEYDKARTRVKRAAERKVTVKQLEDIDVLQKRLGWDVIKAGLYLKQMFPEARQLADLTEGQGEVFKRAMRHHQSTIKG